MSTTTQTQPKKEEPATKQPEPPTQQVQLTEEQQKEINSIFGFTGKVAVGIAIVLVILAFLLLIFFNLGASVLSYHKYGSYFWATINFFFAGIYYPFYAFFLDTNVPPPPTPTESMVGGVVKMLGGRRRSRKH